MKSMTTKKQAKPPKVLSTEAKAIWKKIAEAWQLDDAGFIILQQGLEAFDRMRQAQGIIAAEGMVIKDRFDQLKQHPAFLCERDSRNAMMKAFKQLNVSDLPKNHGSDEDEGIVAKMMRATRHLG